MAIGISLLWSSIGMINMAHGATFAVAGYAAWAASARAKPIFAAAFGKTFAGIFAMAEMTLSVGALAGALMGALILGLVLVWLRVSRKGLEIRAMMQNPEGAVPSGISVRWTALPVTMLTGALAGLAAILLSQTIFVSPTSGAMPLIKGLTIALLGGLGSVPRAVAGAVIIGFLEAINGAIPFLGQRYVLFGTFVFVLIVLILRPRGIGGMLDRARK